MRRLALLTLCALLAACAGKAPQRPLPTVTGVAGKVEMVSGTSRTVLAPGMRVPFDAELVGGAAAARLDLAVDGGSVLRLKGEFRATVRALVDGKTGLDLGAGALLVKWNSAGGGKLDVRTKTAVVGVRGTALSVEVGPAGTTVAVAEGTVAVRRSLSPSLPREYATLEASLRDDVGVLTEVKVGARQETAITAADNERLERAVEESAKTRLAAGGAPPTGAEARRALARALADDAKPELGKVPVPVLPASPARRALLDEAINLKPVAPADAGRPTAALTLALVRPAACEVTLEPGAGLTLEKGAPAAFSYPVGTAVKVSARAPGHKPWSTTVTVATNGAAVAIELVAERRRSRTGASGADATTGDMNAGEK